MMIYSTFIVGLLVGFILVCLMPSKEGDICRGSSTIERK